MTNRIVANIAASAMLLLMLGGCATRSPVAVPAYSVEKFTELIPGVSTIDDAVRLMGRPKSFTDLGRQAVLVWMEWDGPTHLLTVGLVFDADAEGRLIKVQSVTRI